MITTHSFFIPGIPRPQGSKRYIGNGRLIEQSKQLPAWRQQVARFAKQYCTQQFESEVHLTLGFVMPRPARMKRTLPMTARPDVDKLARAVLDGLTGVAFGDDSQVTQLTATKRRAELDELPGVHIICTGELP